MQVYQLSIGAACGLSWPSDRIVIQVLDDSTDPTIKVRSLVVNQNLCLKSHNSPKKLDHPDKIRFSSNGSNQRSIFFDMGTRLQQMGLIKDQILRHGLFKKTSDLMLFVVVVVVVRI